jgi:hypothetical protein
MSDSTAACARGRGWPSRSRTQAAWRGSATRAAEDEELRSARRDIRVRVAVELLIYGSGSTSGTLPPPKAAGKSGATVQAANADGPPGGNVLAFEFGSGFGLM